jgi:hypothetical protein
MQVIFKIAPAEFTPEVFSKIQTLLTQSEWGEIIISFQAKSKPNRRKAKMSEADFFKKIDKAIEDVDNHQNGVTFTIADFEKMTQPK